MFTLYIYICRYIPNRHKWQVTPFPPWCLCAVSMRTPLHVLCTETVPPQTWFDRVSPWQRFCVYRDCSHAPEDGDRNHMLLKTVRGLSREICTRDWLCGPFHELQQYRRSSRLGNVAVAGLLPDNYLSSLPRCWAWWHGRFPHYIQRLHRWRLNCLQKDLNVIVPELSQLKSWFQRKLALCNVCTLLGNFVGLFLRYFCDRVVSAHWGPTSMWAGERVHGRSSQKGRSNLTVKSYVF